MTSPLSIQPERESMVSSCNTYVPMYTFDPGQIVALKKHAHPHSPTHSLIVLSFCLAVSISLPPFSFSLPLSLLPLSLHSVSLFLSLSLPSILSLPLSLLPSSPQRALDAFSLSSFVFSLTPNLTRKRTAHFSGSTRTLSP